MYVYTLKLKPTTQQRHELNKRFRQATDIYRATLHEILKRVRKQKKDPLYKKAYKLPKGKERNEILKQLDEKGEYNKVSLSTRTKEIDGNLVQRDLYSAFLLSCVTPDGETVDISEANRKFDRFVKHHDVAVQKIESKLKSTGVDKFQKQVCTQNESYVMI